MKSNVQWMPCPIKFSSEISVESVSFQIYSWNFTNIIFQENMHNFFNFQLQKCDTCQIGLEFCPKLISDDVKRPPFYFSYRCPSTVPSTKQLFCGTLYSIVPSRNKSFDGTFGCKVPSNNKLFDGTVPSRKQLFDGTVSSRKQLFDGPASW